MSQIYDPAPPEVTPHLSFPSVKKDDPTAFTQSYTYHSVDSVTAEDPKGKAVAPIIEGDWMLGVDEAGRGPVLGPQVYGIAYCRVEYSEELRSHGFADSKTLKDTEREELLGVIIEDSANVHYACTVMSPHDISRGMLRRNPYNLNAQSHDVTINLIKEVIDRGYNVTQAFIDTVGIAADYQRKLEHLFPSIAFVVTSKADSIYPIVSAASIVAKVTRDHFLASWPNLTALSSTGGLKRERAPEDVEEDEEVNVFGSGYPSDPKTVAWLENNVNQVFGFPDVVRFSWQTVKTILDKKAAKVKWNDEPATIQKYFSGDEVAPGAKPVGMWKDFGLTSVGAF